MVGVVNKHATRYEQVRPQLNELLEIFRGKANYRDIETDKDFDTTANRLLDIVKPDDLVVVLGGDGTKSAVAKALCQSGGIMLPLRGGNGNDLDTGLFGKEGCRTPIENIQEGTAIDIHPLDVAVNGSHRLATLYFGMGSTGRGSRTMNSRWFRDILPGHDVEPVQKFYEYGLLPAVAVCTPPFWVNENGKQRQLTEFSVVNGPSMAKNARIPERLELPEAFVTERATPIGLLPWAIKGLRGTLNDSHATESYLKKGETRTLHIRRTILHQAIVAHIDAQHFEIPEGGTVTIGIADESFRAISTSGAHTPRPNL